MSKNYLDKFPSFKELKVNDMVNIKYTPLKPFDDCPMYTGKILFKNDNSLTLVNKKYKCLVTLLSSFILWIEYQ